MAVKQELVIIGIQDQKQADGALRYDELKLIVEDALQLAPYFTPLMLIIKREKKLVFDPQFVQLQQLFRALNTVGTAESSCNLGNYQYLFAEKKPKTLFPHEFLLIVCNSRNKMDLLKKVPTRQYKLQRKWDQSNNSENPNFKTFTYILDSDHLEKKHPSTQVQKVLNFQLQRKKIRLDAQSRGSRGDAKDILKKKEKNRKQLKQLLQIQNKGHQKLQMERFRKQLRSELLHTQIKRNIDESNLTLSLHRSNTKFLNTRRGSQGQNSFAGTPFNRSKQESKIQKVRSSRQFSSYRPPQTANTVIAAAAFNSSFALDQSSFLDYQGKSVGLKNQGIEQKVPSILVTHKTREYHDPHDQTKFSSLKPGENQENKGIYNQTSSKFNSNFSLTRMNTKQNNFDTPSPTGSKSQSIIQKNIHPNTNIFRASGMLSSAYKMKNISSESTIQNQGSFKRGFLSSSQSANRRGPLKTTTFDNRKQSRQSTSNVYSLQNLSLAKNPLHAKDQFIKFAHNHSVAAQHPDLIQKIDQMIEDAAWSVEFSKRVFNQASKMRSTFHPKMKGLNLQSMYNSGKTPAKKLRKSSFRIIKPQY